jgi:hypothetical protein
MEESEKVGNDNTGRTGIKRGRERGRGGGRGTSWSLFPPPLCPPPFEKKRTNEQKSGRRGNEAWRMLVMTGRGGEKASEGLVLFKSESSTMKNWGERKKGEQKGRRAERGGKSTGQKGRT